MVITPFRFSFRLCSVQPPLATFPLLSARSVRLVLGIIVPSTEAAKPSDAEGWVGSVLCGSESRGGAVRSETRAA
jgi:hypothetical protein